MKLATSARKRTSRIPFLPAGSSAPSAPPPWQAASPPSLRRDGSGGDTPPSGKAGSSAVAGHQPPPPCTGPRRGRPPPPSLRRDGSGGDTPPSAKAGSSAVAGHHNLLLPVSGPRRLLIRERVPSHTRLRRGAPAAPCASSSVGGPWLGEGGEGGSRQDLGGYGSR
ncbi:hypothetical protein U9M48_035023, partial [Paspalum notatum var. saurae]